MSLGRPDSYAAYTVRNRVQLVYGGKDYFNTLLELISNAKQCIHLQFYIYENDETGWQVTNALIKAAQKKLDAKVDEWAGNG